jgi:drug/metabolite transporter (DMT)-like permease
MEERLSKKTWLVLFTLIGVVLAVSNYELSAWVIFLGFAGGYTCGSFCYWIDTKFNEWLEKFAEE